MSRGRHASMARTRDSRDLAISRPLHPSIGRSLPAAVAVAAGLAPARQAGCCRAASRPDRPHRWQAGKLARWQISSSSIVSSTPGRHTTPCESPAASKLRLRALAQQGVTTVCGTMVLLRCGATGSSWIAGHACGSTTPTRRWSYFLRMLPFLSPAVPRCAVVRTRAARLQGCTADPSGPSAALARGSVARGRLEPQGGQLCHCQDDRFHHAVSPWNEFQISVTSLPECFTGSRLPPGWSSRKSVMS